MNASLPIDFPVASTPGLRSRTALVLHGGGGPGTVASLAGHVALHRHVLAPTHPGWDGTDRPDNITSIAQLAAGYLALLRERGYTDVVLIGSSIGGWIALEMAVQAARAEQYRTSIGAVVVIDGVGAVVDGEPVADFFALDARELADAAWHDPHRGYIDPGTFTDEQRAMQLANRNTMETLAGRNMSDPTLIARLAAIRVPTLVAWGESDRIVTPAYGRAIADAISGAQFVEIAHAGHLPHLEAPDATWTAIDPFLADI
ncbi:alpha/beta hydrolase [Rhodococcoides fascians A25f]|uniref:alpha/beta fold hydrolase n=1 Tax=Rhodococcoides fascians TaxID=1828 RepID=UPI000567337A|nr:alpha/beta hydrolase [Rhodococcus fascians]QII07232.1 alpha/beta hydrolase [Rhodococcus fascians A25f]